MTQVESPRSNVAQEPEPLERTRTLGLGSGTARVVGNMIGSGIFLLPAALAAFGGISIVGWLFTAAGAMFLALLFAKLASLSRVPNWDAVVAGATACRAHYYATQPNLLCERRKYHEL